MTETLLREMRDGLLILTMNRPERRNAMNPDLTAALRDATAEAAEDPAVRAVLLTGAGDAFCVGGDVKAMNEGSGRAPSLGERIHSLRDRMNSSRYLHEMQFESPVALQIARCALKGFVELVTARVTGQQAGGSTQWTLCA